MTPLERRECACSGWCRPKTRFPRMKVIEKAAPPDRQTRDILRTEKVFV